MNNNNDHSSNPNNSDAVNNPSGAPQFSENDPRLTAYALGEMDASERAAFEAELRDNPAAQAAVAEIRALAGELETAFAAEPAPGAQAAPIAPEAVEEDWRAAREAEARRARERRQKAFRFPYFLVAGFSAACFAVVFFAILKPNYDSRQAEKLAKQKEQTVYVSLPVEAKSREKEAIGTIAGVASQSTPAQTARSSDESTNPSSATPAIAANQPLPTRSVIIDADGKETVLMERFTVTAERTGRAGAIMEQRAAFGGVSVVSTDHFGELTQGSVGEFMKYLPGIGASAVSQTPNTETYTRYADNGFQSVIENPLSTFSADVDTASYTNVRRHINAGRLPPRDAVRVEEMINYFNYRYAPPAKDSTEPFAATMEVASAPWNPEHRLVRIGIKGRELDDDARPPANLVFLLDVSGSMDEPNKLPLVKESMRMLVNRLRPDDRIAIVTYASTIDLALASTPVGEKTKILDTLDALRARGGTNGGKGIQLAYEIAKANFLKDGANRVILCTDGDFNIGVTDRSALTAMIEEKARSGVFLTVLGFGMGNLKDATLQQLANKGNGNHGYIDTRDEARRLLVEQTAGTLVPIAKDVKLQVEFNPAQAAAYRLIGYEKRLLAKEDFNNDKVDAGEIGAGHTVTALYEVVPAKTAAGAPLATPSETDVPPSAVDSLKYQIQTIVTTAPKLELKGELLTLKIRYKAPSADMSDKVEFVLEDRGADFAEASPDFKFTTSVAAFAQLLRDPANHGLANYDNVIAWAEAGSGAGNDLDGRRAEFTDLVRRAKQIATN